MPSEAARPELVVAVRNLSKRYCLYRSPWDRLIELLPFSAGRHREFWALRHINFELERGEVFGILGPNGAGKSTLLRILAGTTRPTEGRAETRGRCAALLDLGAGFHPDFTGRQNLVMTARLMGLDPGEAHDRMPEMIEFAEIGSYIDQPIRTYSTGMVVRLGFAAAAGLDPDLLILDEALAVGDAYFQRKSFHRIERFRRDGKTILIVSHDLRLIGRFCSRALWLDGGRVRALGAANEVRKAYEVEARAHEEERLACAAGGGTGGGQTGKSRRMPSGGARWGNGPIRIVGVEMSGEEGRPGWVFRLRERVELRLHTVLVERVEAPVVSFQIHRQDGVYVTGTSTADNNVDHFAAGPLEGPFTFRFRFDPLHLHAGTYWLSVQAYTHPDEPFWSEPSDFHFQAYEFTVLSPFAPHGVVALPGRWDLTPGVGAEGLPRRIRPGEPEGEGLLFGDWHEVEPEPEPFRWTGREAGVLLRREATDHDLQVELQLMRADGRGLDLEVEVAGQVCGRFAIAAGHRRRLTVTPPACESGRAVQVRLRVDEVWSPLELGLSKDARRLGVAVLEVGWRRPAAFPAREAR